MNNTEKSEKNREIINDFLNKMREVNGHIPKFALGLNSPKTQVLYGGPFFDNNEMLAGIEAFVLGSWGSAGEYSHKFELEFGKYVRNPNAVFVNSGSSANLVLMATAKEYFKWKDEDEIILSPSGFSTTLSVIIQNRLTPVFIDIEFKSLNFDLDLIEQNITDKTKAIFLSPVLGNPVDMDRLQAICSKHNLKLLLDGCDSLGSKYNDKYLTEYAVASTCSFFPAHEICTLEGGMVTSNDAEFIKIARSYASWGRSCYCTSVGNILPNGCCGKRFSNWLTDFPDTVIDHKYVFDRMGYNLKPIDMQGALGLEQLKKIEIICQKRKKNCAKIQSLFQKYVKGVSFPQVLAKSDWVPFATPIICDNKELKAKLVIFLESKKIQTRNYFAGNLLLHPAYREYGKYQDYPNSNKVLDFVFFIGSSPTLLEHHIEYIEQSLKEFSEQND